MKLPVDIDIFPEKAGVYVVGGSVRDLLCGRSPFDYDLAVQHDTTVFARRLAAETSGHVVELGKQEYKMMRVVAKDHFYDIMPVSGNDILTDLPRRDFTINAMALEVSSGNLVDPLGGLRDLKAKKIRMVSREAFRQDPLRLIRAYRMAAAFDFRIDKDTEAAIAADAGLIRQTAGERIREELFKILQNARSYKYLAMMVHSGLFCCIFPEFLKLKQIRRHPHDPRTAFEQTLDSYAQLEKLLDPAGDFMQSPGMQIKDDDGRRLGRLKWSILFHDLGSGSTTQPSGKNRQNRYSFRANTAAALAQNICSRLRFSKRLTDDICFIVQHHFKPYLLWQDHGKNEPMAKDFIRLFLLGRGMTPDVLIHALAAYAVKNESAPAKVRQFEAFIRGLMRQYYTQLRPRASLPPPISGRDLIKEFGLKPSEQFKQILRRVEEERLAKESYTRDEALRLVAGLLDRKRRK